MVPRLAFMVLWVCTWVAASIGGTPVRADDLETFLRPYRESVRREIRSTGRLPSERHRRA